MPIHSLSQIVLCFFLSFLFFNVSSVVAPPVSINASVGGEVQTLDGLPAPAQPTPLPAQPTLPPAQPTPLPAQPTPLPAQPTLPPAQPTAPPAQPSSLPALASMPAQTSASPNPPGSPPSTSPAPALTPAPLPADVVLLQGVASGVRSEVNGIPSSSPGCVTTECVAYYPSVDVFYWPSGAPNTACLKTVTDQPSPAAQPPGMIPPSVYVVYPPATVYDLCGNTADPGLYPPTTETYGAHELSTLQAVPGGAPMTKIFDYGDLPCPPAEIAEQLNPGAAYKPILVAPFVFVHDIENSNLTLKCNIPAIHDPARPIAYATSITGPGFGPPP